MENYTDKFAKRVNDLVEQSKEPKTVLKRVKFRYAKEISTYSDVTFGNTYDVVKITNHYYTIVDDKGKEQSYNKDYFKDIEQPIKQQMRVECIENHYQDINIGDEFLVVKEDETWYWIKAHLVLEEMRVRKFRFKELDPKAVLKRVNFKYFDDFSMYSDVDFENTYDVVKITNHYYTIVDDKGKEQSYNKDYFKDIEQPIKQQMRVECIENHYQDINIGDEFLVVKEDETWYWIKAHLVLEEMRVRKFRFKELDPKAVLKRVKFRYAKEISTYSDVEFGNTYDVVKITFSHYTIINDEGKEDVFHKDYFCKSKKSKKKEKKIKALRTVLNVSLDVIDFSKSIMATTGSIPYKFSTYEDLVKVASEEINKDKPNMKRMKFLMGLIKELTEQTTNK